MPQEDLERTRTIQIGPPGALGLFDWREVLRSGDLIRFLVLRDIKAMYTQSVLGIGWALGQPLITMVLFTVVFGRLARMPTDGLPGPLFYFAAVVPWTYFSTALVASSNSLVANANLISKVYVPRVIIPLTPIVAKLVDLGIALVVLCILTAIFAVRDSSYGFVPSFKLLLLPVALALLMVTAAGMGLLFSSLAIQFRDVKFALPFLSQLMMFSAPVVWPASLLPEGSRGLVGLYPLFGVIETFRAALLPDRPVPWDLLASCAGGAALLALLGLLVYRRQERVFADVA